MRSSSTTIGLLSLSLVVGMLVGYLQGRRVETAGARMEGYNEGHEEGADWMKRTWPYQIFTLPAGEYQFHAKVQELSKFHIFDGKPGVKSGFNYDAVFVSPPLAEWPVADGRHFATPWKDTMDGHSISTTWLERQKQRENN